MEGGLLHENNTLLLVIDGNARIAMIRNTLEEIPV